MLYITSFSNYSEFQEIFGVREFDGKKSRKNKILLSLLKDKKLFKETVKSGDLTLFSFKNLVSLRNYLLHKITVSGAKSKKLNHQIQLLGRYYYSDKYRLDELDGICEDGTPNAVRYINLESGRVFKMKCGKFYKHLIESTKFGQKLNETLVIWLCEEFNMEWQAHAIGMLPKNKLYINDNFADIYNSSRLKGYDEDSDSFISCMVDKDYYNFYKYSVKAKAAYLEDEKGMIIARCIIFPEVYDQDDNVWRYAERQYSYKCNDIYKRALVDALIQAGEIDCFKKIGASCHEPNAILDINGNSLANKKFRIDCELDWEDTLSYQDTFKYYSMHDREANNYCGSYSLEVTEGSLANADEDSESEPDEYDSYHDRDAWEVCTVYYHGSEETCDVEDREDFLLFNGKWYHEDDLMECPKCGKKMLNPEYWDEDKDYFHGEYTNQDYCCEDCRDKAELDYKEENMFFSDYDDEWYENKSDVVVYRHFSHITGDYEDQTISRESLLDKLEAGEMHEWGGQYFDVINEDVGNPYGYETLLEFAA